MPAIKIKTAFESDYSLGVLVAVYSARKIALREGVDVEFEIAVSSERDEERNLLFVKETLNGLGIPHTFSFYRGSKEGSRYVKGISKSKLQFLEESNTGFLWLDSDCVVKKGLRLLEHLQKQTGCLYVVPREAGISDFNSGVFFSDSFHLDSKWREFPPSSFFSDQHILQELCKWHLAELPADMNVLVPWGSKPGAAYKGASILHYVGETKPWKINPQLTRWCVEAQCGFSSWFELEEQMLLELNDTLKSDYLRHRILATKSFPLYTGAASRLLMRIQGSKFTPSLQNLIRPVLKAFLNLLYTPRSKPEVHPFH